MQKKQITGIEPASSAWEADVLPMNYICVTFSITQTKRLRNAQSLFPALKGKFCFMPASFLKCVFSQSLLNFRQVIHNACLPNDYAFYFFLFFHISSWQASPSLLQLSQFRTESFSCAGISSGSVSCRPKLASSSEDIFFCVFLISFFFRQ